MIIDRVVNREKDNLRDKLLDYLKDPSKPFLLYFKKHNILY